MKKYTWKEGKKEGQRERERKRKNEIKRIVKANIRFKDRAIVKIRLSRVSLV